MHLRQSGWRPVPIVRTDWDRRKVRVETDYASTGESIHTTLVMSA
jgi:hypothetical protein